MLKDGKILIGKAEDLEFFLTPSQMNRHGLIAGASGTGSCANSRRRACDDASRTCPCLN